MSKNYVAKTDKEKKEIAIAVSEKLKSLKNMLSSGGVMELIAQVDTEKFGVQSIITQMYLTASMNTKILDCTHASILRAVLHCLKWKLEPNSEQNFVYFVPYKNKDTGLTELKADIGYLGMIQIAYRSGAIKAIDAGVIYENDFFDYMQGSDRYLKFRQDLKASKRGKKLGAYAVIDLSTGHQIMELVNVEDIQDFKDASIKKEGDSLSPAWRDWEDQMIIKSTLKRLLKKCPRISELRDIDNEGGREVIEGESMRIDEALGLPAPNTEEKPTGSQSEQLADMI